MSTLFFNQLLILTLRAVLLTGDLMNRLVDLSEIFIKELLFNLEMEIASFKLTMTKSNLTIDIQMLSLISDRLAVSINLKIVRMQ